MTIDSLSGSGSAMVEKKYQSFIDAFKERNENLGKVNLNEYNAYLDTLSTSLLFLNKVGSDGKEALPMEQLNQLKDKFNESVRVSTYIDERKQQIRQTLLKIYSILIKLEI